MKYSVLVLLTLLCSCSSIKIDKEITNRSPANRLTQSCFSFIREFIDSSTEIIISPTRHEILKLEEIRLNTFKKRSMDSSKYDLTYIARDTRLYTLGNSVEIKLPGHSKYTELRVFGPPVKHNNDYYINIKVWRDHEDKYIGRDKRVLEQISFDNFSSLFLDSYKTWAIKEGSYVILPSIDSKHSRTFFTAWEVKEKFQSKVKLVSTTGQTRYVPYKEIMFHNIGIKDEEQKVINSFFKAGGLGEVMYSPNITQKHKTNMGKHGYYIRINKLPSKKYLSRFSSIFHSEEAYEEALKIISSKDTDLLLTTGKGIYGAYVPPKSPMSKFLFKRANINSPTHQIIIIPGIDTSIFLHEVKHLDDNVNKIDKNIVADLKNLENKLEEFPLNMQELHSIMTYIKEQRAYAIQFQYYDTLAQKEGKTVIQGYLEDKSVPNDVFASKMKEKHFKIFKELYFDQLNLIFSRQDNITYNEVIKIIKKYEIQYNELSIETLLNGA